MISFVAAELAGTPLEKSPTPHEQAVALIVELNERKQEGTPYTLGAGQVRYANRDSFVATVKAGERSFLVVYEPASGHGTIRETEITRAGNPAPFATSSGELPRQRGMGMMPMKKQPGGIELADSLPSRLQKSIPMLMERKGLPTGEVSVTTAPDLRFPIQAGEQLWTATYNPITTTVSGTEGTDHSDLTFRSFLLRLHLTRGYPGTLNTRWFWAVGVDAMAIVLCFWGVSGLLMWWQIKSTRIPGFVVLSLSTVAATALGIAMHGVLG